MGVGIIIIIQTFVRFTMSTLKAEPEVPALASWLRMVVEIVV